MANQQTRILGNRYAVCLLWRPLISGGSVPTLALARAKEDKAQMFVHDSVTTVVGLAYLTKKEVPKQGLFALASMAARAFPAGESIFAIRIGENWWIGAANNGVPAADHVVDSQAEAWTLIEDLQGRRKAAALHGDPDLGLPNCQPLDLEQLQPMETSESALRQVAAKLPAIVYVAAVLVIGFGVYRQAWPYFKARYAPAAIRTAPPVDAVAEWSAAQAEWIKSVKAPTGTDLEPLRQAMFRIPVQVGGWNLVGATCVVSGAWQCQVKYKRPVGMDSESTNRTFERARPKEWKVAWKGGADLSASFEVTGTVSTPLVTSTHIIPLPAYQIDTYSEFQELSKPFVKVDVPDLARVDIPAPRDREGKPIARPGADQLPEIFRAQVTLEGPLRNFEVVEQLKAPVFWREVTTTRTKAEKVGLHQSEFHTVLRGEIYARNP